MWKSVIYPRATTLFCPQENVEKEKVFNSRL
jgi:hypothetical protein